MKKRLEVVPVRSVGPVYTDIVSRRMHVQLTERQYATLVAESARTGLPIAELIRRGVDGMYRPGAGRRIRGYELSLGLWKRPDPAVAGRRVPVFGSRLDARD